ncbi:glycosyltransferase family 2 protein [Bizionia paragorgiae]|uniref:glycosyltransferase family 2 protein n=1 Tax=Bizionia paragorgiae TaxID=283786 RepID=UPI003A91C191
MVEKPLVSICCITYNHEKYIRKCLEGFAIQETNFAFEILVFDDASVDNTQAIILDFAKQHNNVITFLQTENQWSKKKYGLTEWLFPAAKGKYIALCEGDDYWTDPLKLQKQVDFMETNIDCSLCHHSQNKQINDRLVKDERYIDLTKSFKADANDLFSFKVQPQTRTMLFRNCIKSDLNKPFLWNSIYGDFAMCFILAKYGLIGYIPESMATYRITDQGISRKTRKKNNDFLDTRLQLVEMWCQAFIFLKCDVKSFYLGITKLYTQGIDRIGRKALKKITVHWIRVGNNTPIFWNVLSFIALKFIKIIRRNDHIN